MTAEPTPGDLARQVNELRGALMEARGDIRDGMTLLGEKIDGLPFLREDVYRAKHDPLVEKVKSLEEEIDEERQAREDDKREVRQFRRQIIVGVAVAVAVNVILVVAQLLSRALQAGAGG